MTDDKLVAPRQVQAILEDSPVVVIRWQNTEGWPVEFISENVVQILGIRREEFVSGRVLYSRVIHPDDLSRVRSEVLARSNDPSCDRFTHKPFRVCTPDGEVRWVEDRIVVERDAVGEVVCFHGVIWDITERKQADKNLQESRRMLQLILDTIPVRVFWKDKNLNYLGCNRPFAEDAGLSHPLELVGRDDFDMGWRQQAERYRADDRAVMESGQAKLLFEEPQTGPEGQRRYLRTSKIPLMDADGTLQGVLGTYEDITALKNAQEEKEKLQQQFLQAQKIEALGLLAGGLAHDFNNLLTGIIGNVEMATLQLANDEKTRKLLGESLEAALRGSQLTRQLLAFCRRQMIEATPLDMGEVLLSLKSMLRRMIGEDIRLQIEITPDLKPVLADAGQMEQMIVNLVVNARDAMPYGGQISIELRNASGSEVSSLQAWDLLPGDYIFLQVSDTGCGMDDTTRQRIFEPFFTTKDLGRGTGLGLASVYGIISQHKGAIEVSSRPDEGATFRILLPVTEVIRSRIPTQDESKIMPEGRERILIVEDEPLVMKLAVRVLKHLGYTVLSAPNGEQALDLARRTDDPIHLLLTDVVMPIISGPELAERLGKERPEMAVVLTSGYTTDTSAHMETQDSAAILAKPYTPQALAVKVREILDRRNSTSKP